MSVYAVNIALPIHAEGNSLYVHHSSARLSEKIDEKKIKPINHITKHLTAV